MNKNQDRNKRRELDDLSLEDVSGGVVKYEGGYYTYKTKENVEQYTIDLNEAIENDKDTKIEQLDNGETRYTFIYAKGKKKSKRSVKGKF